MHNYLKVKSMSLMEEAKIIRQQERKRLEMMRVAQDKGNTASAEYHLRVFNGLYLHRINDVRKEARWSNIAYGFCMGREYVEIERNSTTWPNWNRVADLARKYYEAKPGTNEDFNELFAAWYKRAIGDWKLRSDCRWIESGNYQPRSLRNSWMAYSWRNRSLDQQ
jgi:hypothetical protein